MIIPNTFPLLQHHHISCNKFELSLKPPIFISSFRNVLLDPLIRNSDIAPGSRRGQGSAIDLGLKMNLRILSSEDEEAVDVMDPRPDEANDSTEGEVLCSLPFEGG